MMGTISAITENEQERKRRKYGDREELPENDDYNTNRSSPNSYDILSGSKNIMKDYANVTDGEGDSEIPDGKVIPFPTITSATVLFSNGGQTMMLSDNYDSQDDRDPVHHPIQEEEDHCFTVNIPRHHPSSSSSISTINEEDQSQRRTTIPFPTRHSYSSQDSNGDVNTTTTISTSDLDVLPIIVSTHSTHNDDDDVDNDVVVDHDHDNDRSSTTTITISRPPITREVSLVSLLSHRDLDCEVRRSCRIRRIQQQTHIPIPPPVQQQRQQSTKIQDKILEVSSILPPIADKDGSVIFDNDNSISISKSS